MPAGYSATTANPLAVSIPVAGLNVTNADFGFGGFGSIGDFVWNDVNGNGIQDLGEVGIAGMTVELRDSGNNLIRTATTDAGGRYMFGSCRPALLLDVLEATLLRLLPVAGQHHSRRHQGLGRGGGGSVMVIVTTGANTP